MPRVIHFELNADNPERAAKFYTRTFGWKINKWDGPQEYWLANTGGDEEVGINGGIMKRRQPGHSTTNTIDVPSVDEFLEKVKANGGKVISPKVAVPGVGYMAYCEDTEGNIFGIMQADRAAK